KPSPAASTASATLATSYRTSPSCGCSGGNPSVPSQTVLPPIASGCAAATPPSTFWTTARRNWPSWESCVTSRSRDVVGKKTKALILAAGLGTRLRPLTEQTPKCLVPIAGRPLLDYWVQALEKAGVTEALINTHHLAEQVDAYVEKVND